MAFVGIGNSWLTFVVDSFVAIFSVDLCGFAGKDFTGEDFTGDVFVGVNFAGILFFSSAANEDSFDGDFSFSP